MRNFGDTDDIKDDALVRVVEAPDVVFAYEAVALAVKKTFYIEKFLW